MELLTQDEFLKYLNDELYNNILDYDNILNESINIIYNEDIEYDINFIITARGRVNFSNPMFQSFKKACENVNIKIAYTLVEHSEISEHAKFCKKNKINYIWIKSKPGELFNKCLSYNLGAMFSVKSKAYLFHDIDCLIQSDFFDKLLENINNKNCKAIQCFTKRRVLYLNQELTNQIINNEITVDELNINIPGVSLPQFIGAPGGSIYVNKDLFFEIGGYDPELFLANSPEDIFFWDKIETITNMEISDNPEIELFHMNHPPTYNSNPYLNKMLKIHSYFKKLDKNNKLEFIKTKSNLIKNYK